MAGCNSGLDDQPLPRIRHPRISVRFLLANRSASLPAVSLLARVDTMGLKEPLTPNRAPSCIKWEHQPCGGFDNGSAGALAVKMPMKRYVHPMSLIAFGWLAPVFAVLVVNLLHTCGRTLRSATKVTRASLARMCFLALTAQLAFPQAPQLTAAGVVNAASYAQPIAPGSIVSIFGTNLAPAPARADHTLLPTSLAGTSVTIGGIAAPLFYVSPGQINAQVPSGTA